MARNLKIASVVVDLVANSARYVQELKKANAQSKRWSRDVKQSFASATRNIAGLAAGYLGVTSAVEAFNKSLANAKEIETLSRMAGASVEEFQSAAYAAHQYGITAEQLGDISKDVADKLGDFIATGGGEFKDFFENVAPQVGLTAQELQHLSGPQILLRVKQAMEQANIPMKQQIFYLEAIANDASKLAPLLADNGAEMQRLTDEYNTMDVALSTTDIKVLKDMNVAFENAGKQARALSDTIVISLSGAMTTLAEKSAEFFRLARENYENAPKLSLEFKAGALNKQVRDAEALINNLRETIAAAKQEGATASQIMGAGVATGRLAEEEKRLTGLRQQLAGINAELAAMEQQPVSDAINQAVRDATPAIDPKVYQDSQLLLSDLTRQLSTQEQLINQRYVEQVNKINSLVLTEQQIQAAGYTSLLQLQSDYLLQADAAREESLLKLQTDTKAATSAAAASYQELSNAVSLQTQVMQQAATSWSTQFSSELANMVMKGKMDFGRLAESIINDMIRMAVQATIVKPLMAGIFSFMGIPMLAKGGPVQAGGTYLVGEQGPEIFSPRQSGRIIPNEQIGGGETRVIINNAPGHTAETKTTRTPEGDVVQVFIKQIDSHLNEQISRGQGIAKSFESRYALTRKSF